MGQNSLSSLWRYAQITGILRVVPSCSKRVPKVSREPHAWAKILCHHYGIRTNHWNMDVTLSVRELVLSMKATFF